MTEGQRDESEISSPFQTEKDRKEEELRDLGLIEGAVGFRDDLEDIFAEVVNREYDISQKKQLKRTGEQGLKDIGRAYRNLDRGISIVNKIEVAGILLFGMLTYFAISAPDLGISALYQGGLSAFITIFTWLISTYLIFALVTAEKLAYQELTTRLPDKRLSFRAKWNKAVLTSSYTFLGIILVGQIRSRWPDAYERGLEIIRDDLVARESEK